MEPDQETDENGNIKKSKGGLRIKISSKLIPDLADFNPDEEVVLQLKCKNRAKSMPEYDESKSVSVDEENVEIELEVTAGGVVNPKESRRKAAVRGLSKSESDAIERKRNGVG